MPKCGLTLSDHSSPLTADVYRLNADPFMDPLRDDPRYKFIVRQLGLSG
jgi:hypothetical protein